MREPQEQAENRSARAAQPGTAAAALSEPSPSANVRAARAVEWRHLGLMVAIVVGLHLLPRLLLGQDSYITIHDNLESDVSYRMLITFDHRFFASDAVVNELAGGLPRWDYPSPFKVGSLLFWLLPPIVAYSVLEAFVRGMAALGMALLLRDYVRPKPLHGLLIAATFGILPFYSIYDLTVAGEPLIAWALLNLWYDRRTKISLASCALYPFASVLWTGSPFFMAMAGIAIGLAAIRERRLPLRTGAGLLVVAIGFLIADRWYLAGLLRADFISHRAAWRTDTQALSFIGVLRACRSVFFEGRYHAASLHTPILFAMLVLAPLLFWRRRPREACVLALIVVTAGVLTASSQIQFWGALQPLWHVAPALKQVNLRFWWSLPLLWYTGLALLTLYWPQTRLPAVLLNALLVFQFAWVFYAPNSTRPRPAEPELRKNYIALADKVIGKTPQDLSYAEFLSAPVFDKIRKHVGANNTGRFLSIGLHPAIPALNGLPCADAIHDNYPLAYKVRFRRLIADELAHDKYNRDYFDNFGIRLYVLLRKWKTLDLDTRPPNPPRAIKHLGLDEAALHDLGIQWILAAVRLEKDARLPFFIDEGVFSDPRAGYVIHLYRVRDYARGAKASQAR